MRKTRSFTLEAIHEMAQGLSRAGAIVQVALSELDRICLLPVHQTTPLFETDEPKT
jgi:DNA-binding transcriptional regulator YiaG